MVQLGSLSAELKADPALWEAALKRSVASLEKLTQAADTTKTRLADTSKSVDTSMASMAKSADQHLGKAGRAINGLTGAVGGMNTGIGKAVGAAAGLAGAFAAGGPMMLGIAAAGVALNIFNEKLKEMEERAEAALKAWQEAQKAVVAGRIAADQDVATAELELDIAKHKTGDPLRDRLDELNRRKGAEINKLYDEMWAKQRAGETTAANTLQITINQREKELNLLRERIKAEDALAQKLKDQKAATKEREQSDKKGLVGLANAPTMSAWEMANISGGGETIDVSGGFQDVKEFTADEWRDFQRSVGAADDEVIELIDDFERLRGTTYDVRNAMQNAATGIMNALAPIGAGLAVGGMGGAGSAAGGVLGAAVDVASGGATGGLGAVIGGALGGLLGNAFDSLIEKLGVLTPLFDALGLLVQATLPLWLVLGVFASALGGALESIAPLILTFSSQLAAMALVGVRLIQALLPLVEIVFLWSGALAFGADALTQGIRALDELFFRPMITAALKLHNFFVDIMNAITTAVRGWLHNDNFGVLLDRKNTDVKDIIGSFPHSVAELRASMEDNTDAVKDNTETFGRELQNLPAGYKVAAAFFGAEGAFGAGGGARGAGGSVTNYYTVNVHTNRPIPAVMDDLRNFKRDGLWRMQATRSITGERN